MAPINKGKKGGKPDTTSKPPEKQFGNQFIEEYEEFMGGRERNKKINEALDKPTGTDKALYELLSTYRLSKISKEELAQMMSEIGNVHFEVSEVELDDKHVMRVVKALEKEPYAVKDHALSMRTQQTLNALEKQREKIEEIRKEEVVSLDELKAAGYLEKQRYHKWKKKIGKKLEELKKG